MAIRVSFNSIGPVARRSRVAFQMEAFVVFNQMQIWRKICAIDALDVKQEYCNTLANYTISPLRKFEVVLGKLRLFSHFRYEENQLWVWLTDDLIRIANKCTKL